VAAGQNDPLTASGRGGQFYFSWLEMLLNVLFSDVPMEFTAATITIEIPAAISAYSIAVAPASSQTKRRKSFLIRTPHCG
jgi:hypothetical protein